MGEAVIIKGTSEGVVITLGDGPLADVIGDMESRLGARASFFRGGRVALHVGQRHLSLDQLQSIGLTLEQLGMTLWAVDGAHPATRAAAEQLGLETGLRRPLPAAPVWEEPDQEEGLCLVVRRTLRSGQEVHHAGHVIILGDLNAGAEASAGGDIIVWGKLRGTVHAGSAGNERAIICALQLAPSVIRIADHIARSPGGGPLPRFPETARVSEGQIVVDRWGRDRAGAEAGRSFGAGATNLGSKIRGRLRKGEG